MRSSVVVAALLTASIAGASTALAAPRAATAPGPTTGTPAKIPSKVSSVEGITEYRLANGLRVLLYPDATKPTVTVNVTYFVGSRHEGYGETGMAHLLEHMLFKGTPRHAEVWKLLQDRGAKFNGTTWYDRTNYYEELPAAGDNLAFALALEADRMVNSKIAADDLAKEFSVVRNEFEMGENNPAGVLEEKVLAAAYQWHNYGKSTIGSRADIERVPVENLRAFYRRFYQPDNALLVVAGKFDPPAALALVTQHFGSLPRPTRKLTPTWTVEPVQDGERVVELRRAGDVAVVEFVYHGVAGSDPRFVAQDALGDLLTAKPSGRLYKALVEKGLATEVWNELFPTAEPGFVLLGAKVRAGVAPDRVRAVMAKVIDDLGRGAAAAATPAELERWRTRSLKEFELALTDTSSVGVALSDWAALGDWRLFFLTRERVKGLTLDEVTGTARAFFKPTNRTVGLFLPTAKPDRAPMVETPDLAAMMKDFKGRESVDQGEAFVATTDNIEARTTRSELPGGLKLALMPKKNKGGAVRVLLTIRYGSEKDLAGRITAANLVPQMLLRGTKKHGYQQIKDELDRLKAEVGFGGGRFALSQLGVSQVRIKTVREHLPEVLSLVTEMLREPAFPKNELELVRKETIAQYQEQLQDPMANGFVTLARRIFPWSKDDVRYIPTLPESVERLKRVTAADVAGVYRSLWGAGSAQLAVVGDFDAALIKAQLEKQLSTWRAARPYARVDRPHRAGKPGEETLDTPDKQMAFVGVGEPLALRDDDPDYPAMVIVNHLVGGSATSRLLNRLRHKDGISYGAFSSLDAHAQDRSGYFLAGAICAPENAGRAMAALNEELQRFVDRGVPPAELEDAKRSYAATWDGRLAEDDFVAGELTKGLYLGRTLAFWKTVNAAIAKLTPQEVQAAARKHLDLTKLAKVQAGDLNKKS